jgi:squalene-hopene/tetraprenyl-beta-curcumene cyclase
MARQSNRREFLLALGLGTAGVISIGRRGFAFDAGAPSVDALTAKAAAFLNPRQAADGSWSGDRNEPGITALVITSLLRAGRVTPNEPTTTKALGYLEQFISPKGGLADAPHANYSTSIALMAFHAANVEGRYDAFIKGSQSFLTKMQWDESEGKTPESDFYGGAGYGGKNDRPDLSNTSFMLEALRDSGVPADDPAMKKALVFVSRCQNLKSEFNDQAWAGKVNDGGFIYTAANGGSSVAGKTEDGGLRSYAGMTYAGLKSMIYAGLSADDPRVKAAVGYIKKNYSVDENPGLGQQGLYYYYTVFSRAMSMLGQDKFEDSSGQSHDWRSELIAALAKRQGADGSWVNKADRFMEGDPNLVTAYCLLALASTRFRPVA